MGEDESDEFPQEKPAWGAALLFVFDAAPQPDIMGTLKRLNSGFGPRSLPMALSRRTGKIGPVPFAETGECGEI